MAARAIYFSTAALQAIANGGGGALTPGTTTVTGATNAVLYADGTGILRASNTQLVYDDSQPALLIPAAGYLEIGNDTILTREAARVFQFGPDASSSSNYELKGNDATGSGNAGGNLTISAGDGTSGAAAAGTLTLAVGSLSGGGTGANVVLKPSDASEKGIVFSPLGGSNVRGFWGIDSVTGAYGLRVPSNGYFLFSSGGTADSGADTFIRRVAAGVVALGSGSANHQLCLDFNGQRMASGTVTLTEAGGAEVVATVTTATTQMTGGTLFYTVRATDGTDRAARQGSFHFVCQNAAGTVTATVGATDQTNDGSVLINTNSKTLTYAIAANVATANVMKLTFNIDSDMTVNAASITWTMILNGPGTVATS